MEHNLKNQNNKKFNININNLDLSPDYNINNLNKNIPVISIEITEKAFDIINKAKINKEDIVLDIDLYKIVIENNELYNSLFNINIWEGPMFNVCYLPSYNENLILIDICCVNTIGNMDIMENASTAIEI